MTKGLVFSVALAAGISVSAFHDAAAQPPAFLRSWPLSEVPMGITIGSSGQVFVGGQLGSPAPVHVYTESGATVRYLGDGDPSDVEGIGISSRGQILIVKCTDSFGLVYQPDFQSATTVQYSGSRRRFVGAGPLDCFYCTDDVDGVVRKLGIVGNGQTKARWPAPQPSGICYLDGVLYVAGATNGLIGIYDLAGNFLRSFPTGCTNAQELNGDGSGNLLLADHGLHQLKCFRQDGTLLWTLGPSIPGYSFGSCDFYSVASDLGGTIFAGDFAHRQILVFSPLATATREESWGRLKTLFH